MSPDGATVEMFIVHRAGRAQNPCIVLIYIIRIRGVFHEMIVLGRLKIHLYVPMFVCNKFSVSGFASETITVCKGR